MALDVAATIIACTGSITAIGGAARFVWAKVEKRIVHIETKLAECEKRDAKSRFQQEKDGMTLMLLAGELQRADPTNTVLERVMALRLVPYTTAANDTQDDNLKKGLVP